LNCSHPLRFVMSATEKNTNLRYANIFEIGTPLNKSVQKAPRICSLSLRATLLQAWRGP